LKNTATLRIKSEEIIDAGRFLYKKGWVPATSGNFSVRVNELEALITSSGKHKGALTAEDLLRIDLQGNPVSSEEMGKPSAETLLHTVIYRNFPEVGAVLHTHSVNATVLTRVTPANQPIILDGYEMLKAIEGIKTHETRMGLPHFPNTQDMVALSKDVDACFQNQTVSGFLIQGHGFYTWATTMEACKRHVEAFEFLFECELMTRRIKA
jgi:methylthioribulose-1-phosphate dehydratase